MTNNRNNSRADWTNYLLGFNNVIGGYSRDLRCWIIEASGFAADGIRAEGYFTLAALTGGRYYATRTNKAHQG